MRQQRLVRWANAPGRWGYLPAFADMSWSCFQMANPNCHQPTHKCERRIYTTFLQARHHLKCPAVIWDNSLYPLSLSFPIHKEEPYTFAEFLRRLTRIMYGRYLRPVPSRGSAITERKRKKWEYSRSVTGEEGTPIWALWNIHFLNMKKKERLCSEWVFRAVASWVRAFENLVEEL